MNNYDLIKPYKMWLFR